jgi:hypothetical protein
MLSIEGNRGTKRYIMGTSDARDIGNHARNTLRRGTAISGTPTIRQPNPPELLGDGE